MVGTPNSSDGAALDSFLLPSSAPAAALSGLRLYHECVLGYARFERWGEVAACAAAQPSCAMAHLLHADFLQQSAGGVGPAGDAALAAAAALKLDTRERGYLAALRATAAADLAAAYAGWLAVVTASPTDLFAAKRGQFCCILRGASADLLEIARRAAPGEGPLGRYHAGLLCFGLEQMGDFAGAEAVARAGLAAAEAAEAAEAAAEPGGAAPPAATAEDGWLVHGLAHALYFQARPVEATELLEARAPGWRRARWHPFLFTHLWWHLALLHAEAGEARRALVIFDEVLWGRCAAEAGPGQPGEQEEEQEEEHDQTDLEVQINALGLLARLQVRGEPCLAHRYLNYNHRALNYNQVRGEPCLAHRWRAVVSAMEGAPYVHAYPLHNLLRLYALCTVRADPAPLLAGLDAAAAAAAETNPALRETIVPLAAALANLLLARAGPGGDGAAAAGAAGAAAAARGLCLDGGAAARARIAALRGEQCWSEVGGSEEQRGFLLELVVGPVSGGKPVG